MIEALQNFTQSLPEWARWAGVMLIAALPFVESYGGSAVGIIAGVHPVVAVTSAVIGNTVSMLVLVFGAHSLRRRFAKREPKRNTQRLRKMFDRWGVPGVSLLGQTVLPSQITSMAMVSFGASRNVVAVWQIISIAVWGILFGVLTVAGFNLLG